MSQAKKCPECGAELPGSAPRGLCPACLLKRGLETNTLGYSAEAASAARWTPPTVEELASRFPELEISCLIGRGGMGAVYQARQRNLDRVVALKILPPEIGRDPAFSERFTREAQAMARLNHPHIVTIHEFGERAGWYYFVMEYVDGVNLRGLLDSGHVSPKEALAIVPQICEALQYAHDQGIVHRDIKPENILLNKQGQVKIADFGLAKLMGQAPISTLQSQIADSVMGTPQYMAPEQLDRPAEVDHRADIYSLGVVFYQMLTGELPVGRFAPPSQKVQIDVRLDEVVLRALEKEPAKRYQHVSEVKTEMETIAGTSADRVRQPVTPLPPTGTNIGGDTESNSGGLQLSRFSRAAIVGAAWAPLFFIVLLMMFDVAQVSASEYHGPTWWQQLLAFTLLPLGAAAPFGTTIMGCLSLSRVRRSSGRVCGLPLALFDALLFPLLALDVAIAVGLHSFGIGFLGWSRNYDDAHNSQLIFMTCIFSAVVDFFIIRRAWHAAKRPLNGSSRTVASAPRETNRVGRAFAFGIIMLGVLAIGSLFFFHRHSSIASAQIHYRVFEASADLVDRLIPPDSRQSAEQELPDTTPKSAFVGSPFTVASQTAEVSTSLLNTLFADPNPAPGLLAETTRLINYWPRIADSWSYSRIIGGGTGGGFLGVRQQDGFLQLRVEYIITHDLNAPTPLQARITWEGPSPQANIVRLFLMPFTSKDGMPKYLLFALDSPKSGETGDNLVPSPAPQRTATSAQLTPAASFAPVIERTVSGLLRLESGDLIDIPESVSRGDLATYARKVHADFGLWVAGQDAVVLDMRVRMLNADGDSWDDITIERLASSLNTPAETDDQKAGLAMLGGGFGPDTPWLLGFRTRDGRIGVLQILGLSKDPVRLNIRYKLVQDAATRQARSAPAVSADLSRLVKYELGASSFQDGDRIAITEVRGPSETMDVAGVYQVSGTCTLASRDQAMLAAFVTSSSQVRLPTLPGQSRTVHKGVTSFTLQLYVPDEGWPHVSLYPAEGGGSFGEQYFGCGPRHLKQDSRAPATQPGGNPAAQTTSERAEDAGQTVAGVPPVVVRTEPASGARDVAPGVTEIHVTFSKEMADRSWSWSTAWEDSTPAIIGQPRYEPDHRTATIKVTLEPGQTYAYWLNSENFHNFIDTTGHPAVPYLLIFQTATSKE